MKKILIMVGAIVLLTTPISAESIGFIDMERVFFNYKDAEKIQKELQDKRKIYKEKVESRQKELKKMSDSGKVEELEKEVAKIEEELKPLREELLRFEAEKRQEIQGKISLAASKISSAYGIDVVLDKQAVIAGGFDLTPFVIERINR